MSSSPFNPDFTDASFSRAGEWGWLLLSALFIGINILSLNLVRHGSVGGIGWLSLAVWVVLMGGATAVLHRYKPWHDPLILPAVGLLLGWGFLLVDRLAPNFWLRQLVWGSIGIAVLVAVAVIPRNFRILRNYPYTWLLGGLTLLGTTLVFGVNPIGFGARLWLEVPFTGVYFQPSELLKLLLIIFLANYFSQKEQLLHFDTEKGWLAPIPYLAPLIFMWGFCMALLVWQQDLGAAVLFFVVFLGVLYVAVGDLWYLIGGGLMLIGAAVFAYYAFDLVALRIEAWWNPWPDANDRAFQIVQSLYALANGRILGQGIGQGFPDYIPVIHSDFAFAAIVEEWGVWGGLGTIMTFLWLTYRGLRIAMLAKRPFDTYLATGITLMFTAQTLLILGGVTKVLPLTGVTLPFVSYGGSSLLMSCIMIGILLYLSSAQND